MQRCGNRKNGPSWMGAPVKSMSENLDQPRRARSYADPARSFAVSRGKKVKHWPCCTDSARVLHGSARLCTIYFSSGKPPQPQAQKAETAIPGVIPCPKDAPGFRPAGHAPTRGDDENTETRAAFSASTKGSGAAVCVLPPYSPLLWIQFQPCP